MPASNGGDDFVWACGPCEGSRVKIVLIHEAVDGGLQVGDRSEDAAFQSSFGELCEEAFDGIEPGARGRREVEGPARVGCEPLLDLRVLMDGIIVEDRVNDFAGGSLGFDGVEKANELL